MKQFDINKVIEHYKLDTQVIAPILFPNVKYPVQALNRILKGEANLDTEQVEHLAEFIGVIVTELFNVDTWKGSSEDGYLTLIKGPYKVKLNYNNVYISLYKNDSLIYQRLNNIQEMTFLEFINYITNIIKAYENGTN